MNIYLITSESFRLMEEEVKKIIKNSSNILTIDLLEATIEDVITEATYVSMFAEQKYIIVKNADFFGSGKIKEAEIELLEKYLENPVSLTTIIFETYNKIDLRKKITKEINAKYKIINIPPMYRNDLIPKIRNYVMDNKYKIDTDTINYIIDACYNNYDLIISELNKIFLYYDENDKIILSDVKEMVSKSLVDNNFKFVEAVINKDFILALKILEDLYVLKVDPINLLMLLAREYRLMVSVLILNETGTNKFNIMKELNLQDWQLDKYVYYLVNYDKKTLYNYLKRLAELDIAIKSGNLDKYMALKIFLLEIE